MKDNRTRSPAWLPARNVPDAMRASCIIEMSMLDKFYDRTTERIFDGCWRSGIIGAVFRLCGRSCAGSERIRLAEPRHPNG